MKLNNMRCKECHKEMTPGTIDAMAGEDGGVRVQIKGMPIMACAEGHKRFLAQDFAVRLMEGLFGKGALVSLERAAQKGLLRKRWVCPGCGGDLSENSGNPVEVARELDLEGSGAFNVSVAIPTFRCASCSKESALPDTALGAVMMKASANGFRAAQVTPV